MHAPICKQMSACSLLQKFTRKKLVSKSMQKIHWNNYLKYGHTHVNKIFQISGSNDGRMFRNVVNNNLIYFVHFDQFFVSVTILVEFQVVYLSLNKRKKIITAAFQMLYFSLENLKSYQNYLYDGKNKQERN